MKNLKTSMIGMVTDKNMKEISVVVPVYNECESVKKTIEELKEVLSNIKNLKYEIITVNDASKDNSYSILKSISGIKILNHKVNKGYGASLKNGIDNSKYEYILITDADGSYPIKEIPNLLKYIPDYDMVIGNRKKKSIPIIRRFPKWVLRKLASFLSQNKVLDLNSGLRIFKKSVAKKFWNLLPERFSFTSTMTMACFTHNYPVKYVPINYYERAGTSSIKPIKDTLRFFSLILRLTMYFNPLRFFVPLSLLFVLFALIRGLRDFIFQESFGGLTLILSFMAFQVFFFGLLADIINKK